MSPLDAIHIELARVRERIAVLQTEERVLERLLIDVLSKPCEPPAALPSRAWPEQLAPAVATEPVALNVNGAPATKRAKINSWTPAEDAILRQHYTSGGVSAAREYLPHRSSAAIYQRTSSLGISSGPRKKPEQRVEPPALSTSAERKEPPRRSFEEQVARVERGEVGIAPAFHASRAGPEQTLGGVSAGMI